MAIVISKRAFEKLFHNAPKLMSLDESNQIVYAFEGVEDVSGEGVFLTIGAGRITFEWERDETVERFLNGINLRNRPRSISLYSNIITVIMPKD